MTITNSFDQESPGPTTYTLPAGAQPPAPTVINLSLMDLQQLLTSIELAVQRGAYRASELSVIGTNFDKVSGFVNQVVAQNSGPRQQPTPEPVAPMSPPFSPKGV